MIILILLFFSLSSVAQVPSYNAAYDRPCLRHPFSYCPAHETLDRIVQAVLKRERGAYISFNEYDIQGAQFVRRTFGLNGKNIFKALPLQCKNHTLPGNECIAWNADSERCYQEVIAPVKELWGTDVDLLYACNALLVSVGQDINYSARFIRLLKNASHCLVITDQPRAGDFFNESSIINSKGRSPQDILSEFYKRITNTYTVVFLASGSQGHLIIPWLLERNCFVFDCGDIFDVLDEKTLVNLKQKVNANIRVLYTAAIVNHRKDERQLQYEKSIKILNSFWYEPYIVESRDEGPTFFNTIARHICYTRSNLDVRNKGVNEIGSMKRGLMHFKFNDDDMILKLTGRYFFKNDLLFRMIEDNPDVDGFIPVYAMSHHAFCGCFALKYKYFKELVNKVSLMQMEQYWIDFECLLIDYIHLIEKNESAHIRYVDELHLEIASYDDGVVSHW